MHESLSARQPSRVPVTRLDVIRYRNGTFCCSDPECGCHNAIAQLKHIERTPVIRIPVNQRHLVCVMNGKFVCQDPDCMCHLAEKNYGDAFYDSIRKLILLLASKFSISCRDEVKDLSEICINRIIKNLDKYDPEFAVSTWVWHICRNILLREVEITRRHREVFDSLEEVHDNYGKIDNCLFLGREIVEAVRELKEVHLSWEDVLMAIFGDVDSSANSLPDDICVADIVRKTHRRYNDIHVFIKTVVRPFFAQRFQINGGVS